MDLGDKNPGEDTSTPTSQWAPPHVWWAGATGGDGTDNNDHGGSFISTNSPPSGVTTRRQSSEAGGERIPLQHVGRDARRVFGDLPNSSYAPAGALDNPIERELRRRSADQRLPSEEAMPLVESTRRASSGAAAVEQQVEEAVVPRIGTAVVDMDAALWREECRRLQGELATLAGQRDRWERDRMQHLDQTSDHARELAGLKRAVEAQSQLVMESLVAAQRFAAENGSRMMTGGNSNPQGYLQSASWVHPNPPLETTSSAFATTNPAVALARRRLEIASEPHRRLRDPRSYEQVSDAEYERRNRSPVSDRRHRSGESNRRRTRDGPLSPRQPTTVGFAPQRVREKDADTEREGERARWRSAHYDMDTSPTERRLPSRHEQSQQMYAPTTTRRSSPSREAVRRWTQRRELPPTEAEMRRWIERYGEHCVNNAGEDDDGRGFELIGRDCTENAVRPAVSAASQRIPRRGEHRFSSSFYSHQGVSEQHNQRLSSANAGGSQLYYPDSAQRDIMQAGGKSNRVYDDRGRGGWRLISSAGVEGDGIDHSAGQGRGARGDVWEWRGRTIVIHSASASSPLRKHIGVQPEAIYVGSREEGNRAEIDKRCTSPVAEETPAAAVAAAQGSAAIMVEMKKVRAAVHALAEHVSDSRRVSFAQQQADSTATTMEMASPLPTTTSSGGGHVSTLPTSETHQHCTQRQPKPPDGERRSRSGSSSSSPYDSPRIPSSPTLGLQHPLLSSAESAVNIAADNKTSPHSEPSDSTPRRSITSLGDGLDSSFASTSIPNGPSSTEKGEGVREEVGPSNDVETTISAGSDGREGDLKEQEEQTVETNGGGAETTGKTLDDSGGQQGQSVTSSTDDGANALAADQSGYVGETVDT